MRRRLLVAKAIVHNPEMLILDEPTAGVDVELRANLWNYIRDLNKKGTTICLTTHYLDEAEELCDYISIIDKGKILKDDTKNNLLNIISNKTVSFAVQEKISIPKELDKYNPILKENNLIINYDKQKTTLKSIINILNNNKIDFKEINTSESDLEDIFIKIINENDK